MGTGPTLHWRSLVKFSGKLQIEADPRNWLKTDLTLTQGRLELVSGGDLLGSWSTAQVKAERVEGDRFQLHLGDDRAVFAADDALAFSYEALPVLAKKTVLATATGLRGKLRKGLAGADRPAQPDTHDTIEPAPSAVPDPEPEEEQSEIPQPPRKLRDLIQAALGAAQGETPTPRKATGGPESAPRGGIPNCPAAIGPEPEPDPRHGWSEPDEVSAVPEPRTRTRNEVIAEQTRTGGASRRLARWRDEDNRSADVACLRSSPSPPRPTDDLGPRITRTLDVVTTGSRRRTLDERTANRSGDSCGGEAMRC